MCLTGQKIQNNDGRTSEKTGGQRSDAERWGESGARPKIVVISEPPVAPVRKHRKVHRTQELPVTLPIDKSDDSILSVSDAKSWFEKKEKSVRLGSPATSPRRETHKLVDCPQRETFTKEEQKQATDVMETRNTNTHKAGTTVKQSVGEIRTDSLKKGHLSTQRFDSTDSTDASFLIDKPLFKESLKHMSVDSYELSPVTPISPGKVQPQSKDYRFTFMSEGSIGNSDNNHSRDLVTTPVDPDFEDVFNQAIHHLETPEPTPEPRRRKRRKLRPTSRHASDVSDVSTPRDPDTESLYTDTTSIGPTDIDTDIECTDVSTEQQRASNSPNKINKFSFSPTEEHKIAISPAEEHKTSISPTEHKVSPGTKLKETIVYTSHTGVEREEDDIVLKQLGENDYDDNNPTEGEDCIDGNTTTKSSRKLEKDDFIESADDNSIHSCSEMEESDKLLEIPDSQQSDGVDKFREVRNDLRLIMMQNESVDATVSECLSVIHEGSDESIGDLSPSKEHSSSTSVGSLTISPISSKESVSPKRPPRHKSMSVENMHVTCNQSSTSKSLSPVKVKKKIPFIPSDSFDLHEEIHIKVLQDSYDEISMTTSEGETSQQDVAMSQSQTEAVCQTRTLPTQHESDKSPVTAEPMNNSDLTEESSETILCHDNATIDNDKTISPNINQKISREELVKDWLDTEHSRDNKEPREGRYLRKIHPQGFNEPQPHLSQNTNPDPQCPGLDLGNHGDQRTHPPAKPPRLPPQVIGSGRYKDHILFH